MDEVGDNICDNLSQSKLLNNEDKKIVLFLADDAVMTSQEQGIDEVQSLLYHLCRYVREIC